jgi:hypothetical protein
MKMDPQLGMRNRAKREPRNERRSQLHAREVVLVDRRRLYQIAHFPRQAPDNSRTADVASSDIDAKPNGLNENTERTFMPRVPYWSVAPSYGSSACLTRSTS